MDMSSIIGTEDRETNSYSLRGRDIISQGMWGLLGGIMGK